MTTHSPVNTSSTPTREYAIGEVHITVWESHTSLTQRWLAPTEVSQKTNELRFSEPSNSAVSCTENRAMKRSKMLSTLFSEINNVFHKSKEL
jgi:hypothetical protein